MYHAWPRVTMVEWLLQGTLQKFWGFIFELGAQILCAYSVWRVKSDFVNVNSDCLIVTGDCVIVTKAKALELCAHMSITCMDIEKRYDCSTKMRGSTTITTAKFDFSFDILGWFSRWRYWQDSTECFDGSLRPTGSVLWILQREVPRQ